MGVKNVLGKKRELDCVGSLPQLSLAASYVTVLGSCLVRQLGWPWLFAAGYKMMCAVIAVFSMKWRFFCGKYCCAQKAYVRLYLCWSVDLKIPSLIQNEPLKKLHKT